jgi:hypothetical protein
MKKFSLLASFAFLVSCASTHGNFISDHQDAWIDGYSAKSGHADRGLLFCRANVQDNGLADPVCYETRFEEFRHEKPRVENQKKLAEKKAKEEGKKPEESKN